MDAGGVKLYDPGNQSATRPSPDPLPTHETETTAVYLPWAMGGKR